MNIGPQEVAPDADVPGPHAAVSRMIARPGTAPARQRCAPGNDAVTVSRFIAGVCVAIGIAAAIGAAWLIWQAPHCRAVPAHAYFTPMERCAR
jgi:hypothetical protein